MHDREEIYSDSFPQEIRDRLRLEFNEEGGVTARLIGVHEVLSEHSTQRLESCGADPETACRMLVHRYETLKQQERLDILF